MDRSQTIVSQLGEEVEVKYAEAQKNLEMIVQFMHQYKATVDDLIKAKSQYVEIIQQYTADQQVSVPTTFPGIAPPMPQYSNSKMQMDSKELSELGTLISEMEDQKELITNQMQKLLDGINGGIIGMTDTASQILVFLSQNIEDNSMNGVYGSPTLQDALL